MEKDAQDGKTNQKITITLPRKIELIDLTIDPGKKIFEVMHKKIERDGRTILVLPKFDFDRTE